MSRPKRSVPKKCSAPGGGGRNEGLQRIVRCDDRRENCCQDNRDEEEQGDTGTPPRQGLETNARGT